MVEYARMRLISVCTSAAQLANSNVAAPTTPTACNEYGANSNSPCVRAIR